MAENRPSLTFKVRQFIDPDEAKRDLAYSAANINDAFMNQASKFAYYGVLLAKASRQVNDIELTIETAEAKILRDTRDSYVRLGKKVPAVDSLKAEVANHPKIIALKKALNEAKQIEALGKTVVEAFRQRKDMLVSHGLISREELKGELAIQVKKIHEEDLREQTKSFLERRREMLAASE